MRTLFTLLAACTAAIAAAQAPAASQPIDPNLILDLLGNGHAMEIELPSEVKRVLLYGVRGGEVLLEQDERVTEEERAWRGGTIRAEVSAGGLNGVENCAVLGFARLALTEAEHRAYSVATGSRCLHEDESHQIRGGTQPIPLKWHPAPHELPLDSWLPFETVWVWANGEPIGPQEDIDSFLIYYLYLSTDDDETPKLPSYGNWAEIQSAYRPVASD